MQSKLRGAIVVLINKTLTSVMGHIYAWAPTQARFLKRVGKKGTGPVALNFFSLCPPPYFWVFPPWMYCFGWANTHCCSPKSLNVKRELFNYHNTVLFLHKIQGGQFSTRLFPKKVGNAHPNYFQGGHMPTLPTQCRRLCIYVRHFPLNREDIPIQPVSLSQ